MSVYGTQKISYTKPFNALMDAAPGLAGFFITPSIGSPSAGAISVDITTLITLLAITDGTMAANNAASTQTALTAVVKQHCVSLLATELDQWTGERDQSEFNAFLNASRLALYLEVVTDLVGGTPSTSITMAAGYLNFTTDGTAAKVWVALNYLDRALSAVRARTQGKGGKYAIITNMTGHGNLQSNLGFTNTTANNLADGGELMGYRGAGIHIYDGTVSGWGSAADAIAAFIVHSEAEAFVWTEASSPHADLRFYGDGKHKKFWQCFGFGGLVQATHYAEIINPSA